MKKLLSILISLFMIGSLSGCLSSSYENGELYIFLPGEYLSDEVVEQFEYEYGVKVYVTTFDSNESMYTKLLGGTVYDILIPSDYMIERLINEKMIQKLDKSKIPNITALDPQVRHQSDRCGRCRIAGLGSHAQYQVCRHDLYV